ncbi:MAG: UDP-N-acetylmuramate dehydrogenase [Eggerthellaceae bacterium]|nr:UDP-N-acetylmuramate dehydrogenase [Eggerthellaceae bacterium]
MAAQHANAFEALLIDDGFEGEVLPYEPMSRHTTFRIGGPARFYIRAQTLRALSTLVAHCQASAIPWVVVGKGSNLLVSDAGFDGVVIVLGEEFRTIHYDEERSYFVVGGGATLATLVQEAFKRAVAGLEFAVGIPGTVGGAVRMNAGSGKEHIGSRVASVTAFSHGKGLVRYLASDIDWSYRACSIPEDEIVVECEIAVAPALASYIRGKMEGSLNARKKSQPINLPSCGSVFKNPDGAFAGELIEGAGLKGLRNGWAMVSQFHANFIVNAGDASAADVYGLIRIIQAKVFEKYGIQLQPEVKFLGFA